MLNAQPILDRVVALAPLTEQEAGRAIRAVANVLIEQLLPHERAILEGALPGAWFSRVVAVPVLPVADLASFYERVAHREGYELGVALEHAQCVCRALAEALGEDGRRQLVSHLPDALGELFALPPSPAPHTPVASTGVEQHPRTLAEGRTGSSRPLAEARPELAHTHSVAKTSSPHADTKLSSSTGTTQEREDETLALGKSKPHRPLSEG